eukprot:6192011-Pleurochrysis_carterae.AAC.3
MLAWHAVEGALLVVRADGMVGMQLKVSTNGVSGRASRSQQAQRLAGWGMVCPGTHRGGGWW